MYKVIHVLLVIVVAALTTTAYGQKNNPGANGAANGQPFQTLQEQIDAVNAELDALAEGNGDAIAAIQADIAQLQQQIADLQGEVDANAEGISDLEAEISFLELQISAKQDVLDGSCAVGSSLRVINPDGSFICEFDDPGSAYVSILDAYSFSYPVAPHDGLFASYGYPTYTWLVATCPAGFTAISGGGQFVDQGTRATQALVAESYALGLDSWYGAAVMGHAADPDAINGFQVFARCVKHF